MADILGFAGIAVSCVSLLFGILALALTKWMVLSDLEIEIGLWEYCVSSVCVKLSEVDIVTKDDSLNAVKAMLFLAIFALVGTVACALMKIFLKKDILQLLAGVLAIIAGLCLMIGFAVFAGELKSDQLDYGAAFALDIVAWLLAWVAGGLLIAPKFVSKND